MIGALLHSADHLLQADDVRIVRIQLGQDSRLAIAPRQERGITVRMETRGDVFLSKYVVTYECQLCVAPPAEASTNSCSDTCHMSRKSR